MSQNLPNAQLTAQGSGAGYSLACADTAYLAGGVRFAGDAIRTISDDGSTFDAATNEDDIIILCETDSNGGTLTLNTADTVEGRVVIVSDASNNAATNSITVDTEDSETIDGSASLTLNSDDAAARLISDGSNWFTI